MRSDWEALKAENKDRLKFNLILGFILCTILLPILLPAVTYVSKNIFGDYVVISKETKIAKVIQVDKRDNLLESSVAYIVNNPDGCGRIPIEDNNTYALYKTGDNIQLEITKYKNAETDIDLKK